MDKSISVLIITSYLHYPPRSGGVQHILSAYLDLQPKDGINIEYIFLTHNESKAAILKKQLTMHPCISDAIGVLTNDKQYNKDARPKWFSEDIWFRLNQEFIEKIIETVKLRSYDIIQVEHSQMAWVVPYLRLASPHSKIVLDLHNVEWKIYERTLPYVGLLSKAYNKREFTALKRWEETIWSWFDAIMTLSSVENVQIQTLLPEMLTIPVPPGGGIDLALFSPNSLKEKKDELIFIGSLEWFPNIQGLLWFLDEVFPKVLEKKPDLKLNIIGSGKPSVKLLNTIRGNKNIIFSGEVHDEKPLLFEGKVFIVPLSIGSGARIKIVTAWAAGIPIVSTSIGAEGLPALDSENIILADDAVNFANGVVKLLEDNTLAEKLRQHGFSIVKKSLTRDIFLQNLKKGYQDLVKKS